MCKEGRLRKRMLLVNESKGNNAQWFNEVMKKGYNLGK